MKHLTGSKYVVYYIVFISFIIVSYANFANYKIGGKYFLVLFTLSYFVLGLVLYGILKWLVKHGIRIFYFLLYLILRGQIQVTVRRKKISYKLHLK